MSEADGVLEEDEGLFAALSGGGIGSDAGSGGRAQEPVQQPFGNEPGQAESEGSKVSTKNRLMGLAKVLALQKSRQAPAVGPPTVRGGPATSLVAGGFPQRRTVQEPGSLINALRGGR